MKKETFDELLNNSYKYKNELQNLSKEAFIKLFNRVYPNLNAEDWYSMFAELSLIGKIHYMMDDETFGLAVECYFIGYKDGSANAS